MAVARDKNYNFKTEFLRLHEANSMPILNGFLFGSTIAGRFFSTIVRLGDKSEKTLKSRN